MEMTLEAAREDLLKKIAEFLQERELPTVAGSWPEVSSEDKHELAIIISNLIVLKWARDADGDLPIAWDLYDKTRNDSVRGLELPRDDLARCIERLSVHLAVTAQKLNTYVDLQKMEKNSE
jgi:hypothetical protein